VERLARHSCTSYNLYKFTFCNCICLLKELFEKNFGIVLETYAVNSLNSRYYFKKGNNEIDIIIKNNEIIPVEIKVSFNEEDMRRFLNKIHSINAKIGIIISLN